VKDKIIEIVEGYDEISDWTLEVMDSGGNELYLIFNEPESIRHTRVTSYILTLYVSRKPSDPEGIEEMTGSATRIFTSGLGEDLVREQIEEAIFAASLALNPRYSLAEKNENDLTYESCDNRVASAPKSTLDNIRKILVNTIRSEPDIKLSSAEIMLTISDTELINSRGLCHKNRSSRILLEFVMLAGNGANEVETFSLMEERFLDILDVENLVRRYAKYTRDNLTAILPKTGQYDVILTEEALDALFSYYAYHVSGPAIHDGISKFRPGQAVVDNPIGERLTMSFDPTLRGGLKTRKYDNYGYLLSPISVIEKGKFVTIQADSRYAEYLGCRPTGSSSNVVIAPGKKSYKELLEDNTFVFSRFSSFEPDHLTGAFSGEIRNGYLFKDNTFHPVKGGSLTGIMDKAMEEVYFSRETIQRGAYFGPRYIKFSGIDVTGG
jgi:PmbA protein